MPLSNCVNCSQDVPPAIGPINTVTTGYCDIDTFCIVYRGDTLTSLGVVQHDTLSIILKKINNIVAGGLPTPPTPTPGSSVWGAITGNINSQTDLINIFATKANATHTHIMSDVTGLSAALALKFNTPSGTTLQYVRGDGTLATLPIAPAITWGSITGTLSTQTDLQALFTGINTSLATINTTLATKYAIPAGTISQYIRGDGSLATLPSTSSGTVPVNFTVQLGAGGSQGAYNTGDVITAGTLISDVIKKQLQKTVLPTYTSATFTLSALNTDGEVGESLTASVNAVFGQNDAGSITALRLNKNGTQIFSGTTSPATATSAIVRINGQITFQGYVDYAAGVVKTDNLGNPDTRTAAIRTANAPQANETNFASNALNFNGYYRLFFGSSATVPATSSDVRALPQNVLSNAGNTQILNTGSTNKIFTISIPAIYTLSNVTDLDALGGTDITSQYILTIFNVNDAGGNPVSFKNYTMQPAVNYSGNHRHSFQII